MKPIIRNVLFGGLGAAARVGDVGLAIARVGLGAYICIAHGFDKVFQEGRIEGIARTAGNLGFPAPTFFAWCAALSEFAGGILLALGLLTRPSATLLAITMAVAAFGRHWNDPWYGGSPSKEMAILYLLPFVMFILTGAGRYSIDANIRG